MIYIATWPDGRQVVLRADNEEQARLRAKDWREEDDPMYDGDVKPSPSFIRHLTTRGTLGVLLAGWSPAAEQELQENP